MRTPPTGHLALLLRTRDGGYAYDTLKELAGSDGRPILADAELALAERDDELSLLAVATFGYSVPAVQRAYERAPSDSVRLSVAGNGFATGTGWCGSVLNIEQASALVRAVPGAISAFATNPRMTPEGLSSLLSGLGPAEIDLNGHLGEVYAALANNPSIPSMIAAGCASKPPSPAIQALLSSLAACPLDPVHAEAARGLLESIWRGVDTSVSLPPSGALAAIAHWRSARDGEHTGSAAFEVRQYLWALSGDPTEPTQRDDVAKRVGSMMRLMLLQCTEETITRLYETDSHAFLCALRHAPIMLFPEPTRIALVDILNGSPANLAAFHAVRQEIAGARSPEALLRPLTLGEFLSAADWLNSILRELAPSVQVILDKAAADHRESHDVSRTNAILLAAFGFLVIVQLLLTILVLADQYHM